MNSDFKYYPIDLPRPLQSGYTSKHAPNMLRTAMADGYTRQRLINQGAPDTVNVTILLCDADYRKLIQWYKSDIRSGQDWFIMPLLAVDSEIDGDLQYRYVRIQNGIINASLVTTSAKARSIYRVTMTLDVSNTVVDDGSWDPITPPAGASDDETGEVTIVDSARIISDVDDLGDSSGTYTIIEE
jgi:hypothetical protein